MAEMPSPFRENEPISASAMNKLVRYLRSLTVRTGDGLTVKQTNDGVLIDLAQRRPEHMVMAKIVKVTPSTAVDAGGELAGSITYDAVALTTDDGPTAAAGQTRRVTGAVPYNRIANDAQRVVAPAVGSACWIMNWWTDPAAVGGSEAKTDVLVLIAQERPTARVCSESQVQAAQEGGA